MTENDIQKMKNFLNEFDCAFYSIENPMEKIEKYFCIQEDWVVWILWIWGLCEYIGKVDVDIADIQNLVNSLRVLAKNYIKNAEENFW